MSRCYFQTACSEIFFDITVFDNRYFSINNRDKNFLAFKPFISFVIRIYADCSICHYGFRPCGCNNKIFVCRFTVAIRNIVFQMVKMTFCIFMDNFFITYSRQALRIPIYHSYTPIYISLVIKIYKGVDNSF